MANRLSVIATRTGDDGSTGLGDGSRTGKDSARVAALGEVDELNSHLGVLLAEALTPALRALLIDVQHDLFDLGAELSMPGRAVLASERVLALDAQLEACNAGLPRLAEFILPGGSRAAALAHVCRTACRRAERALVALAAHEGPAAVSTGARQYCNRLSDLLFVLARVLNREAGCDEPQWQPKRARGA